ncbi:MAG: tRNA (N6-threonylcarbamoyladenosine(37)-N6)-methyltransferase TrmO [Victivallaceae bacterium]|nr:tRNA (N6-threonylcarbamoyladenosine(37)-N6)-methyltransferase TrmO [Victivallaceae bacterium]
MKTQKFTFIPIGVINSPFDEPVNMPIQSASAAGVAGTVEIYNEFVPGLKDIEGFSHIILIYVFHRSDGYKLQTKPFLEDVVHGVFAVRAPKRPNPIGFSVVKLMKRQNNILHIENVDILNGTPLLDIKPYVPEFDCLANASSGWVDKHHEKITGKKSDGRFILDKRDD